MDNNTHTLLQDGMREIIESGAYLYVKQEFEDSFLQEVPDGVELDVLGRRFLQESAVRRVFLTFERYAKTNFNLNKESEPSIDLEDDTSTDDVMGLLDSENHDFFE